MTTLDYAEFRPRLVKFLIGKCKDFDLAEDLAQAALLIAHRNLPTFRGECKVETWVFGIALNEFRTYYTRQKKHPVAVGDSPILIDIEADPQDHPDAQLERSTLLAGIEAALGAMPGEMADTFRQYLETPNYKIIAQTQAIPLGTVRSRINRARQYLKAHVAH